MDSTKLTIRSFLMFGFLIFSLSINAVQGAFVAEDIEAKTFVNEPVSITLTGTSGDESLTPPFVGGKKTVPKQSAPRGLEISGAPPPFHDEEITELSFQIESVSSYGFLSVESPYVIYTPAPGYIGTDEFQYISRIGSTNSAPATVTINVKPKYSGDADGDGVLDVHDEFPNDPSEIYDSNGDGIGNYAEEDEDSDGTPDLLDDYPLDGSKVNFSVTQEIEFNDNINQATPVSSSIPFTVRGTIQQSADSDIYKFSASAGTSISSILVTSQAALDAGNRPTLSIISSSGNPLGGVLLDLNGVSPLHFGISTRIFTAGNYYLVISDAKGQSSPEYNYDVSVFADDDNDGLANDKEIAIGSNSRKKDTDRDGIWDSVESLLLLPNSLVNLDQDNDGVPNWLDIDSDGDSIFDKIEMDIDSDDDSVANYLDMDTDANNITDVIERGFESKILDTDRDQLKDYVDFDDDNDGLPDSIDNDRLVRISSSNELDPNNRIIIHNIMYTDGTNNILNVARGGSTIKINGIGFSPTSAENLVLVKKDKNNFTVLNPISSTVDSLEVELPTTVIGELFVVTRGVRSASQLFTVLSNDPPLLYQPALLTVNVGDTIKLFGENFEPDMNVNVGGVLANSTVLSSSELNVTVPSDASNRNWMVITSKGESNIVKINTANLAVATLQLMPDYQLGFANLIAHDDSFDNYNFDSSGQVSIPISTNKVDTITVTAIDNIGEFVVFEGLSFPTSSELSINTNTTAASITLTILRRYKNLPITEQINFINEVLALPEVNSFGLLLAEKMTVNPRYLVETDQEYLQTRSVAAVAVDVLLESWNTK